MQFTKHTDYGLRTLIYLALNPGRRVATSEIAEVFGVPLNHLSKVVGRMAGAGLVGTFRGKGGGTVLARAPERIVIGDVIRELENEKQMINCERPACPAARACALRDVVQQAQDACFDVLDGYTLHDVIHHHKLALSELLKPALPTANKGE